MTYANPDLEAEFLRTALSAPGSLALLSDDEFYSDTYRSIFLGLLDVYQRTGALGVPDIHAQLGADYTQSLTEIIGAGRFTHSTPNELAKSLKELAAKRRQLSLLRGAINNCRNGRSILVQLDEIKRIEQDFSRSAISSIDTASIEFMSEIESRDGQPSDRVATGYVNLDWMLGDALRPGSFITVAGATSMGKSAFVTSSWALLDEANVDYPRLLISGEMTKSQIISRYLKAVSGKHLTRELHGGLSETAWQEIVGHIGNISSRQIAMVDRSLDLIEIEQAVCEARLKYGGLSVLYVDYLQLMKCDAGRSRAEEVGRLSEGLKQLAIKYDCLVIAMAQVNRDLKTRADKRPVLSDIRDSGRIEQDSDAVVFVHREEYYDADSPSKGTAEFIVRKNRHGRTGTVTVYYSEGQFTNKLGLDTYMRGHRS